MTRKSKLKSGLSKPRVPKSLRKAALHAKNLAASKGLPFDLTEWIAGLNLLKAAKIKQRWTYMQDKLAKLKVVKNPQHIRNLCEHDTPTSTHDRALHKASLVATGNPYHITSNAKFYARRKVLLEQSKAWLETHGFELAA